MQEIRKITMNVTFKKEQFPKSICTKMFIIYNKLKNNSSQTLI